MFRAGLPSILLACLALLASPLGQAADAVTGAQVLIASESSGFKDAIVTRVVEALRADGHTVRHIALEDLGREATQNYRAVALIDTCRAWRPSREVRDFLRRASADEKRKLVVLTTANSGECNLGTRDVDAISSASKRVKVEEVARTLVDRLRAKLAAP